VGRVIRGYRRRPPALAPQGWRYSSGPPEVWHEPHGGEGFRIITREPGDGYVHVVTASQVRSRLAQLPSAFVRDLEVVELAGMTRKKESARCYGLQWGPAVYLYPFDESLEEWRDQPPSLLEYRTTSMFGGRWDRPTHDRWRLIWTEATARDFVLNDVLIHEIGHLNDKRNTNYDKREAYAEWFAIEYGFRATGGRSTRQSRWGIASGALKPW
jgi:hypothetical protein